MQKQKILEAEQPLFIQTERGDIPYNQYHLGRFIGSDYEHKRDKIRLGTHLHTVFNIIKDGKERTYADLYAITHPLGINDDTAGRMVRKIEESYYMGYKIIKNKSKNPITFTCLPLGRGG